MIDFDILSDVGTTNARLREVFTAKLPSKLKLDALPEKERKSIEKDVETRKKFEEQIASWIQEQVVFSLKNHSFYAAVDLAWDSLLNRHILPLVLYAQGRIDVRACSAGLKDLPDGNTYVRKNENGDVIGIDMPKFFEVRINLIRSIITRRLAAQSNKYNNLFPFFKYESRSNGLVGRVRADAVSQRMDIMADQYDYRHVQTQITRDMFLYGHSVAFPRCAWEREIHWEKKPIAVEFKPKDGKIPKRAKVTKEGVYWVNPHPSRVIWDNAYPLSSLNGDNGCEWVGFWDVCRYGDIQHNPDYFNREQIGFSADTAAWFSTYSTYFNQYYDTITPPGIPTDPAQDNDRKVNVGLYTGEMDSSAVFLTDMFVKVVPNKWRLGDYPYPIWLHLKVAGDSTVIFAEIMPSSPAAVFSFNENDSRQTNISMAHELMGFQDQLTNLFSQLLETVKADLFAVGVINEDLFDSEEGQKVLKEFRTVLTGKNYFASMQVLQASFAKLQQVGISLSADNIFKVVRSPANSQITAIFQSITAVIAMAERLMALSPQEQGQPAPREISATETNAISGTTESVYAFISEPIDEGRAAQKRICYESLVSMGADAVHLPVLNRYPNTAVERAGFKVVDEDIEEPTQLFLNVEGNKTALIHDYIFTTRDGGERASNTQQAAVLVQLLQAIGTLQPEVQKAVLGAMGKSKVLDIINEIFRKSDAGLDLKLELKPGDDDNLLMEDDQQVMQIIQRMGEALNKDSQDIEALTAAITELKQATGMQSEPATAG